MFIQTSGIHTLNDYLWDSWLFIERLLHIKVAIIDFFLFQREKLRVYCKHYTRKCSRSSQLFEYLLLKRNFQRFGGISSRSRVHNDVRHHLKEFDT